jgi:hypothetical protein
VVEFLEGRSLATSAANHNIETTLSSNLRSGWFHVTSSGA